MTGPVRRSACWPRASATPACAAPRWWPASTWTPRRSALGAGRCARGIGTGWPACWPVAGGGASSPRPWEVTCGSAGRCCGRKACGTIGSVCARNWSGCSASRWRGKPCGPCCASCAPPHGLARPPTPGRCRRRPAWRRTHSPRKLTRPAPRRCRPRQSPTPPTNRPPCPRRGCLWSSPRWRNHRRLARPLQDPQWRSLRPRRLPAPPSRPPPHPVRRKSLAFPLRSPLPFCRRRGSHFPRGRTGPWGKPCGASTPACCSLPTPCAPSAPRSRPRNPGCAKRSAACWPVP